MARIPKRAATRIAAGIIVGYQPIFFIDEVWALATRPFPTLVGIVLLLGMATLLYLYVEVNGRLSDSVVAFHRARRIFLLGVLQAVQLGEEGGEHPLRHPAGPGPLPRGSAPPPPPNSAFYNMKKLFKFLRGTREG